MKSTARWATIATILHALGGCGGAAPPAAEPAPEPAATPETGERPCGGLVPQANTCGANEYCHYEVDAHCGAADQTGVCRVKPEMCTMDYRPVCGCDDHTYPNACAANAAGISASALGPCPGDETAGVPRPGVGQLCGTRGAQPCPEGLYCDWPAAANCGRADAPGACAVQPEVCTEDVVPVCGCDGQTYPSQCKANNQGVSVEHEGPCVPPPGATKRPAQR